MVQLFVNRVHHVCSLLLHFLKGMDDVLVLAAKSDVAVWSAFVIPREELFDILRHGLSLGTISLEFLDVVRVV